ncbi:PQQ-like beta-propeller repeat protein [Natrinema zhouii]|uniref:PQQ-binding-like beta-propeller repeat protein n=1 Tax=Natrinema zhouii TaxID=1710539 RepID=A0A7D6CQM7_9EURY|nr:PQQ-like beta-propeller repeat protein [Natrinema zhouii]QLK27478.1 PQQ-like beta-propeller repeat protein [Natrinema zhouii]
MEELHRRTLLGTGAALAAGGTLASISTAETDDDCCPQTISEPERNWSSANANPAGGRYVPAETEIEKPETVAWEYEHGIGVFSDLVIGDETVFIRTKANEIHAVDDATGEVEWINDDISAEGTPAFADGSLYVSVGDQLTALDASDGTVQWTRDFGSSVPNPRVSYGRVYAVLDRTVYALDPRDGSTDWKRESVSVEVDHYRDVDSITVKFEGSISVANESVFALAEPDDRPDGVVVALDPRTGDVQWKTNFDINYQGGSLLASDTAVYVDGTSWVPGYHLDTETGESTGTVATCCVTSAAAGEIRVDARETQLVIQRYNGESLETLWTLGRRQATVQTMIVGNTLLVRTEAASQAATNRELAAYDLETGDKRWEIPPDDELNISDILAANSDTVYTRTEDDALRALRSSEAQDGDADGDGSDGGDDGDQNDGGSDDGSNETDDSNGDGDSSDGGDGDGSTDTSGGDSDEDTGSDGGDSADGNEGTAGGSDDSSDTGTANRSDDSADGDGDGSESDDGDGSTESGADADGDGQPGFTPIASLTAGALGLEWFRRRAVGDNVEEE